LVSFLLIILGINFAFRRRREIVAEASATESDAASTTKSAI